MKDEAGRPAETGNRKQWLPQQDAKYKKKV